LGGCGLPIDVVVVFIGKYVDVNVVILIVDMYVLQMCLSFF